MDLDQPRTHSPHLTLVQAPSRINRDAVLRVNFPNYDLLVSELVAIKYQMREMSVRPSNPLGQIKSKIRNCHRRSAVEAKGV